MQKHMTEEIRQVIEKNLPSEVGRLLQERLKRSDELEQDNARLRKLHLDVYNELATFKEKEAKRADLAQIENSISQREKAVLVREQNALANDVKLACAQERVEFAKFCITEIFSNNRLKYCERSNESIPVAKVTGWSGGNTSTEVSYHTKSVDKTVEQEG